MKRKKADAEEKERGRWSSKRKAEVVLRLLRGEDLDTVSREVRVTAATLSQWRDEFLAAGQAGLKSKPTTAADDEVLRLKAMLGEQLMRNELLREAQFRLTGGGESPFASKRSRR